jgi:hypothetical protein
MQLPRAGEKVRCPRAAFEYKPAPFIGGDRDRDCVVGQGVTAPLGHAQLHGFVVPIKSKVKARKLAVKMAKRNSVILIESEG